ncbi:amidohydrolase family protein [Amycolatopsis sp. NPDC059027]|uniref:metal-dependent hydrolase family protein n=1 Tax=unclassified Amycolatopsis TaxID=2618356 RepID=UPI0036707FD0
MDSALWLDGAVVVDGTGRDPLPGTGVLVENGRITRVGGDRPARSGVLDCTGLTLTPGLIDAHVHLGLSSPVDASLRYELSVAELAADIFDSCGQTLDAGFTTVRDTGGIDGGLVRAVERGRVRGPRILPCGPVLCQTGGHGHFAADWEPVKLWSERDVPGLCGLSLLCDGPDSMRRNAREAFRRGATFLKLCVTGGVVSRHDKLSDTQFSVEEIAAAVGEAAARGTYVTVHAHNNAGLRNAVRAGAKCVEHGSEIDEETAALMAAEGVAHVPTLSVVEKLASDAESTGLSADIAARLGSVRDGQIAGLLASRAAGVRVGLGSDLFGPGQGARGSELVLRAKVEPAMAVLVSATRDNAEILGIGQEVGTIEPGKLADLVAFEGDPLAEPAIFGDRSRVVLVLREGRILKDRR